MKAEQIHRQPDPVLELLDRNIQTAIEARSAYVLNKERADREYERVNEMARGSFRRSAYTVEMIADRFGVKPGTVREGVGKFACLRKSAYKPGQRLLFPAQAVEAHESNVMATGVCEVCFKLVTPLQMVKK